jgi:hypothetical protein
MKTKTLLKPVSMVVAIMLLSLSFSQVLAQDKKVDKAEAKFCNSAVSFIESLETLAEANLGTDYDVFVKAYKAADKAWNKLVKSADKLEKVEMKEGVKAYNDLVEQVNKIMDDKKSNDNAEKIGNHITNSISTIKQINGPICD